MRNIVNGKKPDNSAMAKKMLIMLVITIMPLPIAFAIFLNDPQSQMLSSISAATSDFPVLWSVNNPLLSSVMNAWCKTAPFWGLILFIMSFNQIEINGRQSAREMVKGLVLFSVLYFPIMYMLLLHSTEITESAKIYQVMSQNDFLLTLLFMSIYAVCYISTAYYLLIVAAAFKALGKKRKLSF